MSASQSPPEPSTPGTPTPVLSVRIVSIDYYMSPPLPGFDFSRSPFHGEEVEEMPVIRIYGSTPAGQKTCLHIHRFDYNLYGMGHIHVKDFKFRILNEKYKMYTSLSQTTEGTKMVQSLVAIWEEIERLRLLEETKYADLGRPLREEVLKGFLHDIKYESALSMLFSQEVPQHKVSATEDSERLERCFKSLTDIVGTVTFSQDDYCDDIDVGNSADAEALGLLSWLASSQAAEDPTTDDELINEVILSPLFGKKSIEFALESAHLDFDSASQQECQDILDSVDPVLTESRGELRPDPRFDAINAVSMAIEDDADNTVEVHVFIRDNSDKSHRRRNLDGIAGCNVDVFPEEKDLLNNLISAVCSIDPDILVGWEIQLGSLGFLAERAAYLGIGLLRRISRTPPHELNHPPKAPVDDSSQVLAEASSADDVIDDVASQPAMECLPLVMEPESAFYPDPVVVLDFQSLYPSMIIAYNLCYSTCLGKVFPSKSNVLGVSSYSADQHTLVDLKNQLLLTPNGVLYVQPEIFNARQLALKLIANVTYGYTAAGFSGRMPCAELADSIVQCGRRTLETAISFVNQHPLWKARVVYGDTDSMFVLLKGRSREEAFRIGKEIAASITAINPDPVTLKFEKVLGHIWSVNGHGYYQICGHCGGADWIAESGVKCISLACPVFYERKKIQKELRVVSESAGEAGYYAFCCSELF
nr:unnamed protein product [Digitaria exilis]